MSDEQFPGFIDDPAPAKPAKPATSAKPPPAPVADDEPLFKEDIAPKKPKAASADKLEVPFNPFSGVDVGADTATLPPGSPPGPGAQRPTTTTIKRPGTGSHARTGTGRTVRPEAESLDGPDDPDLKPGSRKDLWLCPHCGTGNKPDRSTCRTCAKRPDDPMIKPWFMQPQGLAGLAGGALVVIGLLYLLLRSSSAAFIEPNYDRLDHAMRTGTLAKKNREPVELANGRKFFPKKQGAVLGRVVSTQPFEEVSGGISVLLAVGELAKEEDKCRDLATQVQWADQVSPVPGQGVGVDYLFLRLIPAEGMSIAKPDPGTLLSLEGDVGRLENDTGQLITERGGAKDEAMLVRQHAP